MKAASERSRSSTIFKGGDATGDRRGFAKRRAEFDLNRFAREECGGTAERIDIEGDATGGVDAKVLLPRDKANACAPKSRSEVTAVAMGSPWA